MLIASYPSRIYTIWKAEKKIPGIHCMGDSVRGDEKLVDSLTGIGPIANRLASLIYMLLVH